ncbi:orotidine-5'-phosphate decarboxylase [Pontibacillus sp. HMF3514]|nr:orotidine-5'-phosphate decarboxylase [Pontibacillus sp. HMF3514]QHE54264.1 orotidine-5'-phosphate decarboxylase [Pontibacillus sp. HMF3514]
MKNNPLFLALDFPDGDKAINFLQAHNLYQVPVKVGMELYYQEGPSIIGRLKDQGHPIFLDLKLHDIPNTVKKAMKGMASLGVDVINVHAAGGKEMINAAQQGLEEGTPTGEKKPKLLAVTQLTSTSSQVLMDELLISKSMEETVSHYAKLSRDAGADGVVCSVHEADWIHTLCGDDFMTVTPGIRLKGNAIDDQIRIATPEEARKRGADAIVIGRSITNSQDPKAAYAEAKKEWEDEKRTTSSQSFI